MCIAESNGSELTSLHVLEPVMSSVSEDYDEDDETDSCSHSGTNGLMSHMMNGNDTCPPPSDAADYVDKYDAVGGEYDGEYGGEYGVESSEYQQGGVAVNGGFTRNSSSMSLLEAALMPPPPPRPPPAPPLVTSTSPPPPPPCVTTVDTTSPLSTSKLHTPLAAMRPSKYANVDVVELFPDFRADKVR